MVQYVTCARTNHV